MSDVRKVGVLAVDDSKTMLAMIASQLKGSDFEVKSRFKKTACSRP
jgi:PleD family two-component response regulator